MLARGAREIVMGVSTKGNGYYLWISGTPGVIGQVRSMVYGPQRGGGVHTVLYFAVRTPRENNEQWGGVLVCRARAGHLF